MTTKQLKKFLKDLFKKIVSKKKRKYVRKVVDTQYINGPRS